MNAARIVNKLLESEEAYAQLKVQDKKRKALHDEQMHIAAVSMALKRLGYTRDQVAQFDIRHPGHGERFIVGLWLKKGDYGGKVNGQSVEGGDYGGKVRRAQAEREEASKRYADQRERKKYGYDWDGTADMPTPTAEPKARFAARTPTAYYVPIDPVIRIPASQHT